MTDSKNTPDSGAASSIPPAADAPASAEAATPSLPEGTDSASGAIPGEAAPPATPEGAADAGSAAGAGTPPVESPEGGTAGADPASATPAPTSPASTGAPEVDPDPTLDAPAPATDAAPASAGSVEGSPPAPGVDAPVPATTSGTATSDAATSGAATATDTAITDTPAAETTATDAATAFTADGGVPVDAATAAVAAGTPMPAETSGDLPAADVGGGALRSERISLVPASGKALTVGVRTSLGKHIVRQFGEESNVWDAEQCVIERGEDGAWQIVPREGTTNETLLNGEAITSPRPLHDGDVIAVGRVEKGIAKLPLTVRAG